MSKYDSLKFLKETKARIPHICDNCGNGIEKGEIYYSETIEKVNTIGIKLRKFCNQCYAKHGKTLL